MLHSPCKRGCCWTGMQVCAKARDCPCHAPTLSQWLGAQPADEPAGTQTHRDPTAHKAIRNIERERRRR